LRSTRLAAADPWIGKTMQQIELELLEVLQCARAEYDDLTRQYLGALRDVRDIGLDNVDGNLAHAGSQQTHRAMRLALGRYSVALKRFNQLVVHRQLPPPE
jgi:hypothetical protein